MKLADATFDFVSDRSSVLAELRHTRVGKVDIISGSNRGGCVMYVVENLYMHIEGFVCIQLITQIELHIHNVIRVDETF